MSYVNVVDLDTETDSHQYGINVERNKSITIILHVTRIHDYNSLELNYLILEILSYFIDREVVIMQPHNETEKINISMGILHVDIGKEK